MQLQETLTKENFWDRMMTNYPKATQHFCAWIDEYKHAVGWNNLFGEHERTYNGRLVCSGWAPKFHEIPHAMQLGIWLEYVCQRGGCQYEIENFFEFNLAEEIEGYFKHVLEPELN